MSEHIIIFDWDDTLLSTSFLYKKNNQNNDTSLKQLEERIIVILSTALQFAQVYIITNSKSGWVHSSCKKFIPNLLPLLEKVNIISARTTYETFFPDNKLKWKIEAFYKLVKDNYTSLRHIISFGDSYIEREAMLSLSKTFLNIKIKSIKLIDNPTINQLKDQINFIVREFNNIFFNNSNLDLKININKEEGS